MIASQTMGIQVIQIVNKCIVSYFESQRSKNDRWLSASSVEIFNASYNKTLKPQTNWKIDMFEILLHKSTLFFSISLIDIIFHVFAENIKYRAAAMKG